MSKAQVKHGVALFKEIAKQLEGFYVEKWLDSFLISIPKNKLERAKKNAKKHLKVEALIDIGIGFDYNVNAYTKYVRLAKY